MNIIILLMVGGIFSTMLAVFVVSPLIGGAPITSGAIKIQSILVSLVGAVIVLATVNLFRRGAIH